MGEMDVCVGESVFALLGFFILRSETEIRQSYSKWAKKKEISPSNQSFLELADFYVLCM